MQQPNKSKFMFEKHKPIFNINMNSKAARQKTFSDWKYEEIQKSASLVNCGFYAIKDQTITDLVRCFYCSLVLGCWLKQDDPFLEHARYCLLYTSPSPRDRTRSRMPS